MNIERCFELLEISPDASPEEAKSAYLMMCQVWHPDKYGHNKRLHAKATSKIKEINRAWDTLEGYFAESAARGGAPAEAGHDRWNDSYESASGLSAGKPGNTYTLKGSTAVVAVIFAGVIWFMVWNVFALFDTRHTFISKYVHSDYLLKIFVDIVIIIIAYLAACMVMNDRKKHK